MSIDLQKLPPEALNWLDSRASTRGTSVETEAFDLLDQAVQERILRARLFKDATEARVRIPGPPVTEQEIQHAIEWGRE